MIEFKKKVSMTNGNKLTKKNWQQVEAISLEPCLHVKGVPAIDRAIETAGSYYEKWKLVFKPKDEYSEGGYIFREVHHSGGISGRHKTPKLAIYSALRHNIRIFIAE